MMLHTISLRLLALTLPLLGPVLSIEAAVPPTSPAPATVAKSQIATTMMGMPLQFEANYGQVDARVKFLARGKGYTLFLTPTESVMVLQQREATAEKDALTVNDPTALPKQTPIKQAVVRMKLEGANQVPTIDAMEQLPGIVNYFIGNDPEKWRTKIPTYARVHYTQAYPGIDLAYYGNQGKLEYDFIVAPGADPNQIKLAFEGASDIRVAESGDLLLTTALGDVRLQKPIVYQLETDRHKTFVAGRYVVDPQSVARHASRTTRYSVGFQLASYDHAKPVVIDPVLLYSTYLGGNGEDHGYAIAVDPAGNAYVAGRTLSTNFPIANAFDATFSGVGSLHDVFVTKLNPTGSALVYSTYLGGSHVDFVHWDGIAVDIAGNAYVTGATGSGDFPTTAASFQPTHAGGYDVFVTKLNPTGSALVYSTFLGTPVGCCENEFGHGIAVDASGNAYLTGFTDSTNFPTLNAFQATSGGGGRDAFVTKLNPPGSALVYSTYLGGSNQEEGNGIDIDAGGNAYVSGNTRSSNFPTVNPVQASFGGSGPLNYGDAFVTKLSPAGSSLVYSTFLGGSRDEFVSTIAVDLSGSAHVTGFTTSVNFPTANAFQPTYGGDNGDAFVTKLSPAGSTFVYSTYLGGFHEDGGIGIAVDAAGNAYVSGNTNSPNFPTAGVPIQATLNGSDRDAFITTFTPNGASLVYSTYLGGSGTDNGMGIAVDAFTNAYVVGITDSTNFPVTTGAFQTNFGGGAADAFVAKIIDVTLPPATAGKVTGGGTVDVPGGVGNFGFIVQRKDAVGPITGNLNYHNKASGAKIKDSSFTVFAISGNTAVFEGTCTNNGASCTFRVTVTDNGEPGDTDEFTISISGGAEEGGTLRSGNIQIH